jgi:hypothetical protein
MIDTIAANYDTSRSRIARTLINGLAARADVVEGIISANFAKGSGKQRPKRNFYVSRKVCRVDGKPAERAQDSVCRDLHGAIPAGGCRYPNCKCKV